MKCYLFSVLELCWQSSDVALAVKKNKVFRTISACTALLQNCKIPYVTFLAVSKLLPVTEAGIFWELVAGVFYVDPWAVPVYTYSIQSYCSDKQRCLIKAYIHTVWSSLEQAFSLELNPVTHSDSCPLTVVCSLFCCRCWKFSVNCCAAHSIFCLSPKEIGLSLSLSLLSFSFLDGDQ